MKIEKTIWPGAREYTISLTLKQHKWDKFELFNLKIYLPMRWELFRRIHHLRWVKEQKIIWSLSKRLTYLLYGN